MSFVLDPLGLGGDDSGAREAAANRQLIESYMPTSINTDFGFGGFNFTRSDDGSFTSALTGGPSHVTPHFASMPDFGQLQGLSDQFASIGARFNNLNQDIKSLRGFSREAGDLKPMVRPGFSEFRRVGQAAIRDAHDRTRSNLKDAFARRRTSGSGFTDDTLIRNDAEFAKTESNFLAQSFLQELDATMGILQFQSKVTKAAADTLTQKLTGQLQATAGQSGIQQFITGTEGAINQFNAGQAQSADLANSQIDLQTMQLAFGGTQQALNYINNLMNTINGASQTEVEALAAVQANLWDTIGVVGGAGAGAAVASDIRLKEDYKVTGTSPSGVNIYSFKYKGEDQYYQGVMAQEVPWAAYLTVDGYYVVDYNKVDVDFIKL